MAGVDVKQITDSNGVVHDIADATARAGLLTKAGIIDILNPALTASSGVFTWSIAASSAFNGAPVSVLIFDTSTGEVVYPDVAVNQSTGAITITINDTAGASTLSAGTYTAVVVG